MILNKIKLNKFTLRNRIVVSPMCQYSAQNGSPSKWHYSHLLQLLKSGSAMLMIESTAVSDEGKITHADLCLSNNKQKKNFKNLINFLKSFEKKVPICLQISHAGRKGSSHIPWIKTNSPLKKRQKLWKTFSASSIKKDKSWPKPTSLSKKGIKKIISDFANTTKLANTCGFDGIEIHMAHGYLIHQFLSPVSNKREDRYGGNLKNRIRFALDISKKVRNIWPKNKILGARITGSDHLKDGINIQEAVYLAKNLKKIGFDYVCVSSGGILTKTNLKSYTGFRLKFASIIKKRVGIKTRCSGLLENLDYSEKALKSKKVDLIAIGRNFIKDSSFIFKYAKKTGKINFIDKQYGRCF